MPWVICPFLYTVFDLHFSFITIHLYFSLYIYIYALRYFLQEWGKGCRKSYWLVVQMKKSEKENICK